MNVQTPAARKAGISDEEWRLRVDLAGCYRIFDHLGWSETIMNHITVRVPGPEHHFLINPYGLTYDEVTASNLVKIDLHGKIIGHSDWPVNPAGFVIHSAVHAGREDAICIAHTHTTVAQAVSKSSCTGAAPPFDGSWPFGEPQGEALGFTRDGRGYLTVSEGVHATMHRFVAP